MPDAPPDALDVQIAAYQRILQDVRQTYGSVWALVAHETLVRTFTDFASAAEYALRHYAEEQVLIRHTDERMETAPFMMVG